MEYIINKSLTVSILFLNLHQILAITRLEHEFSLKRGFRQTGPVPLPNWELGLREAVYQALLRERNLPHNLREYLYSAPIIGRQDTATPFGDIAIVARGQLYSAPGGFQFVQDPYQNDCDGCHNTPPRCNHVRCENWKPEGHERLLALWTVKRIRHRDATYGYRYEMEYRVTPLDVAASEKFVTRNGRFDYSVPGHTFIIKSNPRHSDTINFDDVNSGNIYHPSESSYKNQWSNSHFESNFDARYLPPPHPPSPPATEEYYDEDPRKVGYPNVLYGAPETYTDETPYIHYTTRPHTYITDSIDQDLFDDVLNTHSLQTTTAQTPPKEKITTKSPNLFLPTYTMQHFFTPKKTTKKISTFSPIVTTTSQSTTYPTLQSATKPINSFRPTYPQVPLLPTIPIQTSSKVPKETVTTQQYIPYTTKRVTVRFPTTITRKTTPRFTTHTTTKTQFSPSTTFVQYSEPDPLFNTITPTLPTLTSKPYPTKTQDHTHTTPIFGNFDIFGDETTRRSTTERKNKFDLFENNFGSTVNDYGGIKVPNMTIFKIPPGEQVIKVVKAPNVRTTTTTKPHMTAPTTEISYTTSRQKISFNNTQMYKADERNYVTVPVMPITKNHVFTSTTVTLGRVTTTEHEIKTEPITQQSSVTLNTEAMNITIMASEDTIISTQESIKNESKTSEIPTTITTMSPAETTISTLTTTKIPMSTTSNPISKVNTVTTTNFPTTTLKQIVSSPTTLASTPKETTSTSVIRRTSTRASIPSRRTTRTALPTISIRKFSPATTTTQPTRKTIITPKLVLTRTKPTRPKVKFPTRPPLIAVPEETTLPASTLSTTKSLEYKTTHPTTTSSSDTTISLNVTETTTYNIPTTINTESSIVSSSETTEVTTTETKVSTTHRRSTRTTESITSVTKSSTLPTIFQTTQLFKAPLHSSPTATTTARPTTKQNTADFLSENEDFFALNKSEVLSQAKDEDLDLFDKPQVTSLTEPTDKMPQNKKMFNSKEIDEIFGPQPESAEVLPSTTAKVKIIFSDFYLPSTASPTEKTTIKTEYDELSDDIFEVPTTTQKLNVSSKNSGNDSKESESSQIQSSSLLTTTEVNEANETTSMASEINQQGNSTTETSLEKSVEKTTTQMPCNVTQANVNNTKILNALTLSVVNHAKSINILSSSNNSAMNDTRQRKYKRKRTYRVHKIRRRIS